MAERAARPMLEDRRSARLLRREPRHTGRVADAGTRRAVGGRPQRHGQDHAVQHHHRPEARPLRLDPRRRPRGLDARAARDPPSRRRLCAARAAGVAEPHRRRASAAGGRQPARRRLDGRARLPDLSAAGRAARTMAARSCPAASSRCWRSRARCSPTRSCWSWTSRPRAWRPSSSTRSSACWSTLAEEGEMAILVIEQNIGVATAVSDHVAIMVNGRINRIMDAQRAGRRPRAAAAPARRRPPCRRGAGAGRGRGRQCRAARRRRLSHRARRRRRRAPMRRPASTAR